MNKQQTSVILMVLVLGSILIILGGCANPLTRLVPKIEMPSPPNDLMKTPLPLKTIIPPVVVVDAPKTN